MGDILTTAITFHALNSLINASVANISSEAAAAVTAAHAAAAESSEAAHARGGGRRNHARAYVRYGSVDKRVKRVEGYRRRQYVAHAEFSLVCGRLKTSGGKFVGLCFIPAGLCALVILFYTLLIPSAIIPLVAKLLISLSGCVLLGVSVILINRSKEYNAKLNEIIGFKQFITLAEKDRLEKMIESDPQFYYHILPYANSRGTKAINPS